MIFKLLCGNFSFSCPSAFFLAKPCPVSVSTTSVRQPDDLLYGNGGNDTFNLGTSDRPVGGGGSNTLFGGEDVANLLGNTHDYTHPETATLPFG